MNFKRRLDNALNESIPKDNDTVLFRQDINRNMGETILYLRYAGKECSITLPSASSKLPEGLTGTAVKESYRTGSRKIQLGGGLYLIHSGWKMY